MDTAPFDKHTTNPLDAAARVDNAGGAGIARPPANGTSSRSWPT